MHPADLLMLIAVVTAGSAIAIAARMALAPHTRHPLPALAVALPTTLGFLLLPALVHPTKSVNCAWGVVSVTVGAYLLFLAMRTDASLGLRNTATTFLLPPAFLCVAGAGTVIAIGGRADQAPSPVGFAVNAISGELETSPAVVAPTHSAYIDGGDILRVCNLSIEADCSFNSPPRQMVVHGGDLLLFKALLHNSGWRPVPYAKLFVAAGPQLGVKPPRIGVSLEIAWPLTNDLDAAERPEIQPVVLNPSHSDLNPSLHYVHGSTALVDLHDRLIARLPDGIIGPVGIALTEIGAPKSCFECDRRYIRFVSFRARVDLPR
jgi:hypothetical protein